MNRLRFIALIALLAMPLPAAHAELEAAQHDGHLVGASPALIDAVRRETEQFRDVRRAAPDYGPVLGCVSGPDVGAMGVHFVNPALLMDDVVEAAHPEALIYEFKDNLARLVGVEFIVFASLWHATHEPNDPPVLDGHLLHFVDSPNRFGLPAHYELHVWAWRENPNGAFADWNPRISCEAQ
jgi:hypothetical protein